jgi:type IV pilus assembly protein PilA
MSIHKQGFSLIELIVVLIITAILAQIGFVAFNKYLRRTRAFAAKTALLNIKKECESNSDLKSAEEFTALAPKGYSLFSGTSGDCNGNNGLIFARPNNPNRLPEYSYNFAERGGIQCSKNSSDNFFKECMTLKDKLESNQFVVKDSYLERGCSAYAVVEGRTWDLAQSNAQKIGGNLVTVNDKEENNWLTSNVKWLKPPNPNFGAYGWNDGTSGYYPNGFKNEGGGKIISYWIGLKEKDEVKGLSNQYSASEEEQRKNVEWADGSPVEYMNQGRTDAGNGVNEDYFVLNNRGYFNDIEDPLNPTYSSDWQQVQYGIAEIDKCKA